MHKPNLSIVTTVIDGVERINFYLVIDNHVIASASLVYANEPMPVLMSGFVCEAFRNKGYWKWLYSARLHAPLVECLHAPLRPNLYLPLAHLKQGMGAIYAKTPTIVGQGSC